MTSPPPPATDRQSRRWVAWLAIVLFLVFIGGLVTWMYVKSFVAAKIKTQLAELNLGETRIGDISVGVDGVAAHNIEFKLKPDDENSWLKVASLSINHPITELAAGATTFNEIKLSGAQAFLSPDQLIALADNGNADSEFDLSQIKLPAKKISVSNSNFQLQDGERSLHIVGVDLQIAEANKKQVISGHVADLLGGHWQIRGEINPKANTYAANVSTKGLHLKNDQWQSLPYIPENLRRYFSASGTIDIATDITGSVANPVVLDGTAKIQSFCIDLPSFNLPIDLQTADATFDLDRIHIENFHATIDSQAQFTGTATTNISSFPITTAFEANFTDLSGASLRRIVPAIPEVLIAQASGQARGTVAVAADTQTTIKINATGDTLGARYGDLEAKSSKTSVDIESLVFDAQQQYQSISGLINVRADAARQPSQHIFSTFGIEALAKQLDLAGHVSGRANIDLPLDTIGDIKTWGLSVTGAMPEGKLAGQSVENVDLQGRLNRGVLELSSVTATVPNDPNAVDQLSVTVAWPLVVNEATDTGTVVVSGNNLPIHWAVGLIQNQIFNATGKHLVKESSDLAHKISDLGGDINFGAQINIPADQPDAIGRWTATGNVRQSKLIVQQQSLNAFNTDISLNNSKLSIANITGDFPQGGSLTGDATIDLNATAEHKINVDAQKVPLPWLLRIAQNASPALADGLKQATAKAAGKERTVQKPAGVLDLSASFLTLPLNSPTPWIADVDIASDEIRIFDQIFKNLNVKVSSDSANLTVKRLKTNFPKQGVIDGAFNWNLARGSGNGNLNWKSLSIKTLAIAANLSELPIAGHTDGQLVLKALDRDDPNFDPTTFPVNITGSVLTTDLTAAKIKVKPFRFDISTRAGKLQIENFRTENKAIDVNFSGSLDLKPPFAFNSNGTLSKLRLSRLLAQSSVTQKEGAVADVTGVMSGKFSISGQAAPFRVRTNGRLRLKEPAYNNRSFDDIELDWHHTGNDWANSKLHLSAFGGDLEITELTQYPQRIGINIANINAIEITSLFDFPVQLNGTFDGTAELKDWDLSQQRQADLKLKGSSLVVSGIEIGDFAATVGLRNDQLNYGIDGALMGGKFEGRGATEIGNQRLEKIEFPIEFKLSNALLAKLERKSPLFRSLKDLDGNLSAVAEFVVGLNRPFEGDGRVAISDAKWNNELLTRSASIHFNVDHDRLLLNDVRADLKRGKIKASATIALRGGLSGRYDCDIRQMDLARIAAIVSKQPLEIEGLFDARLNGQIGDALSGRGYLGVDRASLHGVNGQSVRLPIQFSISTATGSGQAELRRSTFRLFDGTASGTAKVTFGSRTSLNADLKLSRIDTGKMMRSVADFDQAGQGELNGRLKIKGNRIRTVRDLKGSFEGELDRTSAFQLPVLADLGRALAGNRLQSDNFSSEDIVLQLNNGRVEVKSLNFSNPLATVAISGFMFVDGRLDMGVAARIERFNEPTLLEQLADSPLAQIRGTPASFIAQAANFISDRVVFLKVSGTANRPQIRVDSRQQLREETIRHFLRGSQILPIDQLRNN